MSVEVTSLRSGLRVATDTVRYVETVSLGIWVNAGARLENKVNNGVAHFLEHMAFKGTKTRSAQQIAEAIEGVGGSMNAYTSREVTAYYVRILKENVPLALEILSDILENSTFAQEEMDREREVILQEIGRANDTPDDIVYDYFQEQAYLDQSLGQTILGPTNTIRSMPRQTLIEFMDDYYSPKQMVVAAAGNISHEEMVKLAEMHCHFNRGTKSPQPPKGEYIGGERRETRDLEQLHLLLGFKGVSYHDPALYTAAVAAAVMGGGMSSRLFQEIREKRGLVYSIYAFSSSYTDTGTFGIYAGTGQKESCELLKVTLQEMNRATRTLTLPEVDRAKAQIKASTLMALESMSSRARRMAQNLFIYDRVLSLEEIIGRIDAVSLPEIQSYIGQLIASPLTFACVGPTNSLPSFDDIKEFCQQAG